MKTETQSIEAKPNNGMEVGAALLLFLLIIHSFHSSSGGGNTALEQEAFRTWNAEVHQVMLMVLPVLAWFSGIASGLGVLFHGLMMWAYQNTTAFTTHKKRTLQSAALLTLMVVGYTALLPALPQLFQ